MLLNPHLQNVTLGLLPVDGQVAPDKDTDTDERQESTSSNDHLTLDNTIGCDDTVTDRVANGVLHLESNVSVDSGRLVLGVGGKSLVDLLGEIVGPKSARDTETDGLADRAKHGVKGEGDSKLLVADRGHDGERTAHGPDTTANTMEDLAHDKVTDLLAGLTEVDEKSRTEDTPGDTGDGGPVVAAVVLETETDEWGQNGRGDGEGIEGVTSGSNAHLVDNLEVG